MFSVMYGNSVFSIVLAMGDRSDLVGSLCEFVVFVWFWNGNDCGTFSKMGYCVSVKGNVVHVFEASDGKWP